MTAAVAPAPATRVAQRARRGAAAWQLAAALGLAAAGGLHVAAAVDHLSSGDLAVGFFLFTALVQAGLAAWLLLGAWTGSRPGREVVAAVLLTTVGLIALYVIAYTTDLLDAFVVAETPSGQHAGTGQHGSTGSTGTTVDPNTGVALADGMATRHDVPVAMDGPAEVSSHGPKSLGTTTVAAELVVVAALAALLPAAWRDRALNGLLVLGGSAWALWLTGVLG